MKKLMSAAVVALGLALLPMTSFAGSGCCPAAKAQNAAAKDAKTSSCGAKVEKAGMGEIAKGECASICTEHTAKGGAEDPGKHSNAELGYELGKQVPNFTLTTAQGESWSLSDADDAKAKMLVFWNQKCPYVVEVKDRMSDFAKEYSDKGVVVVGIDAGTNNSTEAIKSEAEEVSFPLLVNEKSDLALHFGATRTPEVYLLNAHDVVVYHGAFDNGAKGVQSGEMKTYAKDAVEALLAGEEPQVAQTRAFGCTIKYNPVTKAEFENKSEEKQVSSAD